MLSYKSRHSFNRALKRDGIPFIRINRRRIVFEAAAVRAYLDSRTVGGVK
jgi:hypothetical protein